MERTLIDTSILVEPFVPWKNNEPNYKQACLTLLRGKSEFKPVISLSILGEYHLILNQKEVFKRLDSEKIRIMKSIINRFVEGCDKVGLKKEVIEKCNEILVIDKRIEPLDALHISTAVVEKCDDFVFIDYGIKNSLLLNRFAKENGLNLLKFAIKKNSDYKRVSDEMIWRE